MPDITVPGLSAGSRAGARVALSRRWIADRARPFDPVVKGEVVAVAVALASRFARSAAPRIGDEVGEREAVMGGMGVVARPGAAAWCSKRSAEPRWWGAGIAPAPRHALVAAQKTRTSCGSGRSTRTSRPDPPCNSLRADIQGSAMRRARERTGVLLKAVEESCHLVEAAGSRPRVAARSKRKPSTPTTSTSSARNP